MKKTIIKLLSWYLSKNRNEDYLYDLSMHEKVEETNRYIRSRYERFGHRLLFRMEPDCKYLKEEREVIFKFCIECLKENNWVGLNILQKEELLDWFFDRQIIKKFFCNILETGHYAVSFFEQMSNYYDKKSEKFSRYELDFSNEEVELFFTNYSSGRHVMHGVRFGSGINKETNILVEAVRGGRTYSVEFLYEKKKLWNKLGEKEKKLLFKECSRIENGLRGREVLFVMEHTDIEKDIGVTEINYLVKLLCAENDISGLLYIVEKYFGNIEFEEKVYRLFLGKEFENERLNSLVEKIKLSVELKKDLLASEYIENYKKKKIQKV